MESLKNKSGIKMKAFRELLKGEGSLERR